MEPPTAPEVVLNEAAITGVKGKHRMRPTHATNKASSFSKFTFHVLAHTDEDYSKGLGGLV